MKLTRANAKAVKYACMKFHYAKAVPVNTLGYNVYNDAGEWCGVVVFGTGATPNMARPYKTHPKSVYAQMVVIDGKKVHCPQTIDAVRKYLDPDATIFKTQGKRKYIYPLTKQMREKVLPLAKPYPKKGDK